MNWKHKAAIYSALSCMPGGEALAYLLQRFVSRSLPIRYEKFLQIKAGAERHLGWLEIGSDTRLYEYGAGWHLSQPIINWCFGAEHQHVVDLHRHVRPKLVVRSLEYARRLEDEVPRVPPEPEEPLLDWLEQALGIAYRAPIDARATAFDEGHFDAATSSRTLEHIPVDDIRAIHQETLRILRPGGLYSMGIDYQDHYSYADPNRTVYSFLAYSEREWRRFSPSLHYQNRLRHVEHRDLLEESGFEIVADSARSVSAEDLATLARTPLSRRFRHLSRQQLAIRNGYLLARKPQGR